MMLSIIQKWAEIIGQARQSVDFLKDQDVIRTVLNILQVWIFFILVFILELVLLSHGHGSNQFIIYINFFTLSNQFTWSVILA